MTRPYTVNWIQENKQNYLSPGQGGMSLLYFPFKESMLLNNLCDTKGLCLASLEILSSLHSQKPTQRQRERR